MSEAQTLTAARVPTVYFIDDSATMREVIKIAFRKENIHVVTCADAASALAQFGETSPDAVITDVIMPDRDGYEVCEFVRHHAKLSRIPVILMSGIVNQTVAEKAMKVKADELIRKPFQPQDLIARVKGLIGARTGPVAGKAAGTAAQPGATPRAASGALSDVFSAGHATPRATPSTAPRAEETVANITSRTHSPIAATVASSPAPTLNLGASAGDVQKLRHEILRLELLVKRLQAELAAGREYCAALEGHFKRLQESE